MDFDVSAENGIYKVSEEICILEIAEESQVNEDAKAQPEGLPSLFPGSVYALGNQKVRAGDEDEYEY